MNSIALIGRLTADPELRTTHGGAPVAQMRVAVARRRGKQGEDRGAVFVDVVCFGALAESCAQYLETGRQVAVNGRLELDEWETDAGERRSRHKVLAAEVEFLGGRRSEGDGSESVTPDF
jgi:single-strand DNA-binding protein